MRSRKGRSQLDRDIGAVERCYNTLTAAIASTPVSADRTASSPVPNPAMVTSLQYNQNLEITVAGRVSKQKGFRTTYGEILKLVEEAEFAEVYRVGVLRIGHTASENYKASGGSGRGLL
jgi:hypothetical protein